MKTQILRRQNFLSKDSSPAPEEAVCQVARPDKKAREAKVSLLADLASLQKKSSKTKKAEVEAENSDDVNNNNVKNSNKAESAQADGDEDKRVNPFLAQIENAKSSKPRTVKQRTTAARAPSPASGQDQLQRMMAARRKLVEETDEGAETAEAGP